MKAFTLSDGTNGFYYLEDSGMGRVVVTLANLGTDFYRAQREYWSIVAEAESKFALLSSSTAELAKNVKWIQSTNKQTLGEILPNGTAKPDPK